MTLKKRLEVYRKLIERLGSEPQAVLPALHAEGVVRYFEAPAHGTVKFSVYPTWEFLELADNRWLVRTPFEVLAVIEEAM